MYVVHFGETERSRLGHLTGVGVHALRKVSPFVCGARPFAMTTETSTHTCDAWLSMLERALVEMIDLEVPEVWPRRYDFGQTKMGKTLV